MPKPDERLTKASREGAGLPNSMNAEKAIEELIGKLGASLTGEKYLEALQEMESRASSAIEAYKEEHPEDGA